MDEHHEGVKERVEAVERRLANLESGLHSELRTERLVVTDGSGFERVIVSGAAHHGSVVVRCSRPNAPGTFGVELYALDDPDGDMPEAGVCLIRDGDVASRWRLE